MFGVRDMDALIGHTGFVGGHLAAQHDFDGLFHSRNVDRLGENSFDTTVCAAAPGSMLTANRDPEADAARIEALCTALSCLRTRRFVLISSIAVLARFDGQDDEETDRFQTALAYGRNRRRLEVFCADRFDDCLILRLPALFGTGLRKNFLFDLMNPVPTMLTAARLEELRAVLEPDLAAALARLYAVDATSGMAVLDRAALARDPDRAAVETAVTKTGFAAIGFHNPDTTFQFYDMTRLWSDIGLATEAGLDLLHLATEPLRAGDIHLRLTGREMPDTGARLHHEDMHTRHAALRGRTGPYLSSAGAVMDRLASFHARETARS